MAKQREDFRQDHWNKIFETKDTTKVLWHEKEPKHSLKLIKSLRVNQDDAIIDVGCGTSLLVDRLLAENYSNITLLDTSSKALDIVKQRIDNRSINYLCQDLLSLNQADSFDLWHDRALFHFLLTIDEQKDYLNILENALRKGGLALINTFNPKGPKQCAGLETLSYDEESFRALLPHGLELVSYEPFTHITPLNTEQAYSSFILKKL